MDPLLQLLKSNKAWYLTRISRSNRPQPRFKLRTPDLEANRLYECDSLT